MSVPDALASPSPAKPPRKRILFVVPTLGGGAARVIVTLLRHLDRQRFELQLAVIYTSYGYWFEREVPPDVTLHVLAARRARHALPRLLATIWRVRPAVVVSTQGYINFLLLLAQPFFPGSRLVVREVIGERYMEHNRYRDLLYRWYLRLVRRADRIVTQSEAVARDLTVRCHPRPGQVICIHNPVDVARLSREATVRPSPYVGPGPHVLALGRLTHQKGFDLLLEGFAGALADGVKGTLTIVGTGELHGVLQAQAARLGITDAVRLVGFQEDPYPYYGHADLFVLSSRYEGMPNALLEALACGCPVVAYACPHGVREIVQHGVNGLLLPPEDVAALRHALVRLLATPQERTALRAQIAPTLAQFAAPAITARWGAVLEAAGGT